MAKGLESGNDLVKLTVTSALTMQFGFTVFAFLLHSHHLVAELLNSTLNLE